MASLQPTSILGNLIVGDGVAGTVNCNGTMTIAGGGPAQYSILRQQSGTSGLVEWIAFVVYDTDGTTRLF
jgi:hypothetical protein